MTSRDASEHGASTRLLLHEITRKEAARRASGALVVLPVGATEQHGPHLPLGTDFLIVEHVTRAAAQEARANIDVLVAPTFQTGSSHHHLPLAGRSRWRPSAITARCATWWSPSSRAASAASSSSMDTVGTTSSSSSSSETLPCHARATSPPRRTGISPGNRSRSARPNLRERLPGHAGAFETSLIMALRPDLVAEPTAAPLGGGAGTDGHAARLRFVPNVTASGRVSTATPIARIRRARSGVSACSRSSSRRWRRRSSALRVCRWWGTIRSREVEKSRSNLRSIHRLPRHSYCSTWLKECSMSEETVPTKGEVLAAIDREREHGKRCWSRWVRRACSSRARWAIGRSRTSPPTSPAGARARCNGSRPPPTDSPSPTRSGRRTGSAMTRSTTGFTR